MKRKKVILSAILSLGIGLTGLQAQSQLYVKDKAGTETSYALSNIGKLTFSAGNVVVNKSDGSSNTFALNDLRYLAFKQFSSTEVKHIYSKETSNILLYPNPVIDELQIRYESIKAGTMQVEIIDLQGRVLHQEVIISQNGVNHANISLSQLGKGLYICRLHYGDKFETIKIIKN